MTHLLVVRYGTAPAPTVEVALLDPESNSQPEVLTIPAIGAYLTGPTREASYAWLVGHDASKVPSSAAGWAHVELTDDTCNVSEPTEERRDENEASDDIKEESLLRDWRLMTGLFLEVARSVRTRVDHIDRRIDVVAVGRAVAASRSGTKSSKAHPPGWLRLVLERLGWTGHLSVCRALPRGAAAVFETNSALPARIRYTALANELKNSNLAKVPFGQRRIDSSLKFVHTHSSGESYTQWVVREGESLPVQSDIRLVLDYVDIAPRLELFWQSPGSERSLGIALRPAQRVSNSVREPREKLFASVSTDLLAASDPNGGVRMILEIDRFGRCYMTLRDEFDRLIAIDTLHPNASDGPAWTAILPAESGVPRRPADRIYLSNLFFGFVQEVDHPGNERLPGAIAQTSFNGQPGEGYHLDLRSRQRQGATLAYAREDVKDALDLHLQRWGKHKHGFLRKRILGPKAEGESSEQRLAAIEALIDDLPQDMHHFRALLRSLPRSLSERGRDRERT